MVYYNTIYMKYTTKLQVKTQHKQTPLVLSYLHSEEYSYSNGCAYTQTNSCHYKYHPVHVSRVRGLIIVEAL